MHTNETTNYNLPQFVGTDKPTWLGDVNGAMLAIDTAIAGVNSTASGADSKADTAISTANTAASTASDAATLANTANTNANSALTTAGNAAQAASAVDTKVGALTDLTTTDKTSVVAAINEVESGAGAVDTKVGALTDLTTTDKTSVVAAINEVNAKPAGGGTALDITYDNTTSGLIATNVQAAIDELKTLIPTHPQYTTAGLTEARATITDGGYYIDNGVVHVDMVITTTSTVSAGDGTISGFPEAQSVNTTTPFNITPSFNETAICHSSVGGNTYLGATSALNVVGTVIHYIGQYTMKPITQ